jgi:hypothetical protein
VAEDGAPDELITAAGSFADLHTAWAASLT